MIGVFKEIVLSILFTRFSTRSVVSKSGTWSAMTFHQSSRHIRVKYAVRAIRILLTDAWFLPVELRDDHHELFAVQQRLLVYVNCYLRD